jgi:hypothetical protein
MSFSTLTYDEPEGPSEPAGEPAPDAVIRAAVTRLSRPRPSGGTVIERAAILAEGSDGEAIIGWILSHGGRPEAAAPALTGQGLHGSRLSGGAVAQNPSRYVLPPGALS